MVNYYIYAKDYSGSTRHVSFYHENGLKTLEKFKSDMRKLQSESTDTEESRVVYLHWGHECVEVDEETAITEYKNKVGTGSATLPETIIHWIKKNIDGEYKIKLIYIITDGLIGSGSLNRCLQLNENVDYENVVFHGLHAQLNSIDLSVAASFLKGRCTIYRNNELFDDTDISQDFDYSKITIDNFITEKENLKSYIKLKYINSPKSSATALREIDMLKNLRNVLFANLSHTPKKYEGINLHTTDKNEFIQQFKNTEWYRNLYNSSYDLRTDIEKSISTLINYITCEKKSYAFDALKFQTTFRKEVVEEPIVDVNFTTDQEIEFPDIILDDEKGIPVILCTELNLLDKIIFSSPEASASFSKFQSTMECPLFLLNDPDLNDSIGYFYTLTVYKQLLQNTNKTEPRTRRPFHGGLVLVDTDDFDKYNDYILSATYFNFKKVNYNVGLFYFVLWKICEKKQWMDENVVEKFKKYMLRRISTTVCKIGLSSLPLDPQVRTSLPAALWYCVEMSSHIFKDDSQHFVQERLRMHYGIADYMIEILQNLRYDLDLEFIDKRRDIIKHVMTLKRIPTRRKKVFYMLQNIFKNADEFLVCEIENTANVKKLNYLKLDHRSILRDDIMTENVDLNDYVYFLHETDNTGIQISKDTFRPFFMVDQDTCFYSVLAKKAKNVTISARGEPKIVINDSIDKLEFSRILSVYNLFLRCVKASKKFPTIEEYKQYVLRKKKFNGNLVNIFPMNVHDCIEAVFREYESVIKDVSVSEFISVSDKYVKRLDRIKAEHVREFESDDQINEFISKQECKVNLVKMSSVASEAVSPEWGPIDVVSFW